MHYKYIPLTVALKIDIFMYKHGKTLQSQFKEDIGSENEKLMFYSNLCFRAGAPNICPLLLQSGNLIGFQKVRLNFLVLALRIFFCKKNLKSKEVYEDRSFQFSYVRETLWFCTSEKKFRNCSISKFTLFINALFL